MSAPMRLTGQVGWLHKSGGSRPIAIVIGQEPTYACTTPDLPALAPKGWLGRHALVGEALMGALGMRVGPRLVHHRGQRPLAQQEPPIQGFLLDGAPEPFTVGVQMQTSRGQDKRVHPAALEHVIQRACAWCLPVVEPIALAQPETVAGVGQWPGAWLHQGSGEMRGDARHRHSPRGQLHDHAPCIGHQAVPCGHLDRENVCGREDLPKVTAFRVGQAQATAPEAGFQDTVSLLQIRDAPLLVPLDPPSDQGDQEMKPHRRSSGRRP